MGEIESEDVEHLVVDDEHLAVIADEVISGAGYGNALRQQAHFKPSQILLFALIRVGNESLHRDAAANCIDEGFLNLDAIETEYENPDVLFCFFKSLDEGLDAVIRLNEQLHSVSPWECCNRYVIKEMQCKDQWMHEQPWRGHPHF